MSRSGAEGFRVVAISPNMPGSPPPGMNGEFSRMTILSSPESAKQSPTSDPANVAFVKGGKRKRLSKACDACHKSKRRCDGTAPCSNCYFASKECTYTDSSGRPVPAPRVNTQDRSALNQAPGRTAGGHSADHSRHAGQVAGGANLRRQADTGDTMFKRVKPETSPRTSSITPSPSTDSGLSSPTIQLDSGTELKLINLFFAHCNPHRLIIHKTSFLASLTHERVPRYLILAICALAAPWAKDIANSAPMPRLAGVPFFQEAVSLMFDASASLLSEPTLATAQALALLEMHEVAASHSWTKDYRYFDLAMQVLEDALEVHRRDTPSDLATFSAVEARQYIIERECTRRCFWLIQCMHWINGIYTYRPMRPRCGELMKVIPLPIDEDSFELGRTPVEPEFLHIPGPRRKTASEFGHVCRALSMYQTLEAVLATQPAQSRPPALSSCREAVQTWLTSLPAHLRFSQENLDKQIDMFETGSTGGAWCYCFMHALHPCYILELTDAEGRLEAEPISWVRDQLDRIFKATGHRAKNTILSACALWTYSKYYSSDPRVKEWDDAFEGLWGFRVTLVAEQWRKTQSEQQSQIGRTYPVDSVSQSDSSPAFAVASSDSSSPSSPRSSQHSPRSQPSSSQPSSTRSSPRDRHAHPRSSPPASYPSASDLSPNRRHSQHSPPQGLLMHRPVQPQQSLPSLKASGLLDSWKPPTEAFVQSGQMPRQEGLIHSPHDLGRAGLSWRHSDGQ